MGFSHSGMTDSQKITQVTENISPPPSFQHCVGETNIVSTQDKKITKDELKWEGVSRDGELLKTLHV